VKILFVQPNATKAIIAFREVSTQDEISTVAAAFGLHAIGAVGHGGAVCAVHGVVAQPAPCTVRTLVAVFALAAEHAVRAAGTFFTGIANGVCRYRCELLPQAAKLLQKSSAVYMCNELFSVHNEPYEISTSYKQMDKFKCGFRLCSMACARDLTFVDGLNKQLPPSGMAPGFGCPEWSLKKCRKGHTALSPKTSSALGF